MAMLNIRVDFPTPGSPPIILILPATIPPPKTKSSSSYPVVIREVLSDSFFSRGRGTEYDFLLKGEVLEKRSDVSSIIVFQLLHVSHFPAHLAYSVPQD